MKIKIIALVGILALTGCGLAKVDQEQNSNIAVIAQAHNALAKQVELVTAATEKALGPNIAKRQDIFKQALVTPTPEAKTEVDAK